MKITLFISIILAATSHFTFAKEFIVKYEKAPWETNKPYLDDEYTKAWYAAQDKLDKQANEEKSACKVEGMSFKERMDCLSAIKAKFKNPEPIRGSMEYIEKHYTKNSLLNGITAPKLKALLVSLAALRAKTRQVTIYGKPDHGELTFEQVNREICEIENVIGFVSSGRVCVR